MGIPRVVLTVLFVLFALTVLVLGVVNVFAEKFGLARDSIMTGLFALFAGTLLRLFLPSKDRDRALGAEPSEETVGDGDR